MVSPDSGGIGWLAGVIIAPVISVKSAGEWNELGSWIALSGNGEGSVNGI